MESAAADNDDLIGTNRSLAKWKGLQVDAEMSVMSAAAAAHVTLHGAVVGIEEFLHHERPVVTGTLKEK